MYGGSLAGALGPMARSEAGTTLGVAWRMGGKYT